ncbi:MAG TPA: M23 family metallopeptidase [Egibacteraceae bacterium]|nr:M23 family metallopeptidase [Egibacteraceae bacterium]
MRARLLARRFLHAITVAVVVAVVSASPGLPSAGAGDPRLDRALERRQSVQARLDALVARLGALQAQTAEVDNRLVGLTREANARQHQADTAHGALAARARQSYKHGAVDPTLALFASGSVQQAAEQARVLGLLAMRSRDEYETATSARVRTEVAVRQVDEVAAELRARRSELDGARAQVAAALAEAQRQERDVRAAIAAEEAARAQAARQRAARAQAAARSRPAARPRVASAGAVAAAAVVGGAACPVGQPRSYSDTYGAARSGGRSHKGTDILAPRGTPIFAYEAGTVTRTGASGLGGITLYLRGTSGTVYYYAHLQGFVRGVGPGQRVSAGQQIATNGDTGNARGTPHLHFEVRPGGGGNVNPYPYVRRACG